MTEKIGGGLPDGAFVGRGQCETMGIPCPPDAVGVRINHVRQAESTDNRLLHALPLTDDEIAGLVRNAKHGIPVIGAYFSLLNMVVAERASHQAKATRAEVYAAIDSERAYQATRWNRETTETGGVHENLTDWLLYMRRYIGLAEEHLASKGEPEATIAALHELRKVTALGVAAMEQIGAPRREGF